MRIPPEISPLGFEHGLPTQFIGYQFRTSANPTENSKIFDGETTINIDTETLDPETDIYALAIEKLVSVTPLSVDLTSRVQFDELQETLGG